MSTKKKALAAAAAALMIFIISPLSRYALSLGVMSVYSGIHQRESIMAEKGIKLEIPGGGVTEETDWYPFVMTFNPGASFGREAGDRSLKLTILYNFGAFDLSKGCSRLYDRESEYYNSFYGAYLVTHEDESSYEAPGALSGTVPGAATGTAPEVSTGSMPSAAPFGFDGDGHIIPEQTAVVPRFDFGKLVLADFGLSPSEQIFEWTAENVTEDVEYLGFGGWSRVDASLLVNGAAHIKDGFRQSYLQYGSPGYEVTAEEKFAPVEMRGRIYGKYFEEWDTSIFFYVLTPEQETLEMCDRNILSKSLLQKSE